MGIKLEIPRIDFRKIYSIYSFFIINKDNGMLGHLASIYMLNILRECISFIQIILQSLSAKVS